ncbi:hypothetical protein PC9H_000640 [Pleurotus ostreatus]|uniref:Fe2OG dioxygenase domain-containing protein n=1 Tax=Pleurotus ostreatus TaxID=5322 RepID=A0A8H7A5F3_PLEOS|nr:uncharacterized protein PC9H_000640 [Pleurotus ostreatus]KAF7440296.1 hypothetical protein PC9H_000640 [Pleurotus ostreatus]KAJ8700404.1 hypothetical protein PTI98_003429 [Pleurotus ostreatus]
MPVLASSPYPAYPPFPEDVPTHPLLTIDYNLIKGGDEKEKDRLFVAATTAGFWYLKNHGLDEELDEMFNLGIQVMKAPLPELMKYEQGDSGLSAGYKAAGAYITDRTGGKDAVEFMNITQDDVFAWPKVVRCSYPSIVEASMESVIRPFSRKAIDLNLVCMDVLNDKLGFPPGKFRELHKVDALSTSEARIVRTPPPPPGGWNKNVALGAHTDFGSMSLVHNRLGGLQVYAKGSDRWQYVKPLPGHVVCNVGDTLNILSGGVLQSNLHRVALPPGAQSAFERCSVTYFTRPSDDVVLRALTEDSPLVAEAASKNNQETGMNFEPGVTAGQWVARRIKYVRVNNHKSPEDWFSARGTEHQPLIT